MRSTEDEDSPKGYRSPKPATHSVAGRKALFAGNSSQFEVFRQTELFHRNGIHTKENDRSSKTCCGRSFFGSEKGGSLAEAPLSCYNSCEKRGRQSGLRRTCLSVEGER